MKLLWDKIGERLYETGVKQGVLYPQSADGTYPKGVAWSGLTAVTKSPSGAEPTALYADDIKYLNLYSAEDFAATIEAYTSPVEFDECNGIAHLAEGVSIGQQGRKAFGFSFKSIVGNDVDGNKHGYKLHLIYGAKASPAETAYSSLNENPEAITMSWEISTTPVSVPGFEPTACITIDSTMVDAAKLAKLEAILYGKDPTTEDGNDGAEARLPLPDEVASIFKTA